MADLKISKMTKATTLAGEEIIPIVQNGSNKSVTVNLIKESIDKSDIGLENVDNTSDLNKPISTATQTALDAKVDSVDGKGLSENDYTTVDKAKLADIEA